jgi:hypothetical protein
VRSRIDLRVRAHRILGNDEFHQFATRPVQVIFGLAAGEFTAANGGSGLVEPPAENGRNTYIERRWQPFAVKFNPQDLRLAFTLSHLRQLGSESTQNWFNASADLTEVFDLYLAILREDSAVAELRFLMTAQALETYHRRRRDESLLPETEWKDLLTSLTALVAAKVQTESQKAALLSRLSFLNEASLKRRLKSLLQMVAQHESDLCSADSSRFVRRIVVTRNHFTHWSGGNDTDVFRDADLVHATERLIALLELILVGELGFPLGSPVHAAILERRIGWLPKLSS